MADVNLELVSTGDLLTEFFRRHKTFIFLGVPHGHKDGLPITHFQHQNVYEALGLLDYLKDELKEWARTHREPEE